MIHYMTFGCPLGNTHPASVRRSSRDEAGARTVRFPINPSRSGGSYGRVTDTARTWDNTTAGTGGTTSWVGRRPDRRPGPAALARGRTRARSRRTLGSFHLRSDGFRG